MVFLIGLLSSNSIAAVTPVANPVYVSWAKCRPGTCITIKSHDSTSENTVTQTLVRTTPDRCVLKVRTDNDGKGQVVTTSIEIQRQFTDPEEIRAFNQQTAHSEDEIITTPAGTFACKRYEYVLNGTGTVKVWMCEDVPGGMVRKSEAIKSSRSPQITELIDIQ
jgi:hypothetical protein